MSNYTNLGKRTLIECPIHSEESQKLLDDNILKRSDFIYTCDSLFKYDGPNNGTVIYCNRKKKKLTLVVGESWTYGDSLTPYVKCADGKDNLSYRISKIFPSKMATYYDSDLLLCATPGQSNCDILNDLNDSLKWVQENTDYSEVKVIVQLTSPGRCIRNYNDWTKYDLFRLFSESEKDGDKVYNFDEWHEEYEKIMLFNINDCMNSYGVNVVVWKNFNEFLTTDHEQYNLMSILDLPAQRYVCELSGFNTTLPLTLEADFYEKAKNLSFLDVSEERLYDEMEKLNYSYGDLNESLLNNWHFNESGHWVWFLKLKEKFDLIKGLQINKTKKEII